MIFKDTLLFTSRSEIFSLKTGKPLSVKDLIFDERGKMLTFYKDSIYAVDLFTKETISVKGNPNFYSPPLFATDSILIYPTIYGISAYNFNTARKTWSLNRDKLSYSKVLRYQNSVLATQDYYDWKTDSLSHSVVRILNDKSISNPIDINEPIRQMELIGDRLAAIGLSEIVIVDVPKWAVVSKIRLNVSQEYVHSDQNLISPNISVAVEQGKVAQNSSLGWQNGPLWKWNNWLILNFDDGEVTRQFLVTLDRKRTFMLDYMAADFQPCLMEGFGDRAVLDFINSEGRYIAAICKCDNGYFLYGFDFPELPEE